MDHLTGLPILIIYILTLKENGVYGIGVHSFALWLCFIYPDLPMYSTVIVMMSILLIVVVISALIMWQLNKKHR